MGLYRSAATVAGASGDGVVDWNAVREAAKQGTDPGKLSLSPETESAYAADVRAARDGVADLTGMSVDLPETVAVQDRHHWIDAATPTFRRTLAPLDGRETALPGVARVVNTASMATVVGFLARHVVGQYDPLLLAGEDAEHALYVVHPNLVEAADALGVDRDLFRRWIAFHEVTHAAEFATAPWLQPYLEDRVEDAVEALADGEFDVPQAGDLQTAMTVVEGYAELVMDRAFDRDASAMRAALEARRGGGGPLVSLFRRVLGIGLKREQYERGRAFFETVVDDHDLDTATLVWRDPDNLPTAAELDDPWRWVSRVA
ncbi:MAG: zinc-dependent metalloprotease [Halobacteriaceae archaeon]